MKIHYLLFVGLLFSSACNTEAIEPKFQKVQNIQVIDLTATKVTIDADAIIYNPNPVSAYLNEIEIDVFANDMLVGHIEQSNQTEILKKDNFNIPLSVSFNPTYIFKDNLMGLLESALSSYENKKVDLSFQGYAQFEVKGVFFNVPIDYLEEILLKEE